MLKIKWCTLILAALMLVVPVFAIEEELTIVGGDEVTIREFLQVYMRDMAPPETETTIYIGQLPEELPVELPESDATIIGAITRVGPYSNTELIYMTDETVDATDEFYESELASLGWERIGVNYGQRGFITVPQSYGDYCQQDSEVFINVNMRQVNDGTQIRININQTDPYMCNQQVDMNDAQRNDPYLRLPELSTPEGVTVQFNRGGGGGGGGYPGTMYSSTSTWLTSETLSLTELMDAYNTQLVGNGWEQVTSETGDHISLSLWTFSDEDTQWSGYFSLMESAAMDGDFYATIMVEQIEE